MTNAFELSSEKERREEYIQYKGKEVGLDSPKGTFYGVVENEDRNNIYLKPHLVYNPLPLADGKMINNIEKRNTARIVPKNLLSKLVHEYPNGYLNNLVEATNQQDEFSKLKFENESSVVFQYREVEKKE